MITDIEVGDIVLNTTEGATTESKIRKIIGPHAFIDYYDGPEMIFRKEQPVLIDSVILIAKGTKPLFIIADLKKWFNNQ